MMIYSPKQDTLTQSKHNTNFKSIYDDAVIEQSLWYIGASRLYQVRNASKHIKKEILKEMTQENEYLIRVDIQHEWIPEKMETKYKSEFHVLRKVQKTIPEQTITKWEEIQ